MASFFIKFVKFHDFFFNKTAAVLDLFKLKWDQNLVSGFLLLQPDFHTVITPKAFIKQTMGYNSVYVIHLGFISPASIQNLHILIC